MPTISDKIKKEIDAYALAYATEFQDSIPGVWDNIEGKLRMEFLIEKILMLTARHFGAVRVPTIASKTVQSWIEKENENIVAELHRAGEKLERERIRHDRRPSHDEIEAADRGGP